MALTQQPAVHCFLAVFFLLLCGGAPATPRAQYHSVSVDSIISSKAQVNCYDPDTRIPAASSGNKFAVYPACAGGSQKAWHQRNILVHDSSRLSTILKRSTTSSSTMPPAPAIAFPPTSPAPAADGPSATIPDIPGTYLDTLEFVVVVGLGTPTQPSTLILDTGSDLSWVECQPCPGHCHKQQDPVFNPTKSSTYGVVPCGTPTCSFAGNRCNGTTCLYTVQYGDGSSTSGALSQETLTLSSSRLISGFVFGCGTTNLGDFGEVDGLLGLGRGHLSLPSQTASSFSYCLPSSNNSNVPGFFSIGSTTVSNNVQYTAMIRKPEYPSLYFVELVNIIIGGYALPVPPTVFTSTGTLLDSGTILTYIPSQAYTLLRDRFKFTMMGYKPAPPFDILDTCYDFSGQSVIVEPAISFKFSDGAILDLSNGPMIFPDDTQPAIGCLSFVSRPAEMPFSIIGNRLQISTEVIYDVGAGRIGFVPVSCS